MRLFIQASPVACIERIYVHEDLVTRFLIELAVYLVRPITNFGGPFSDDQETPGAGWCGQKPAAFCREGQIAEAVRPRGGAGAY